MWGHIDVRAAYRAMQAARGGEVPPQPEQPPLEHATSSRPVSDAGGSLFLDDSELAGEQASDSSAAAPPAVEASPPLLWNATFFLERMALRQSLAWETRPRWWTAAFTLGMAAGCMYVLRIAFGTFVLCPQYDSGGQRYYDYCMPA